MKNAAYLWKHFGAWWRNSQDLPKSRKTFWGKFGKDTIDFDLFSQLTYMAAIAATGAERSRIFHYAAEYPSALAPHFREIEQLAQNLNYDYAEACRIIAQSIAEERIRSVLLRLSVALSSGDREEGFFAREARVQAEVYSQKYQRDLERLKGWGDAFVSLIITTTLITIVALISSMIFRIGTNITTFVMTVMGLMMVMSLLGALLIYRAAPDEVKFLPRLPEFPAPRLSRILPRVLLPISVASGVIMVIFKVDTWIILPTAGIMVFTIGLLSLKIDRQVDNKDKEIGTFFRSLGSITPAIGMTVKEGLDKLDMRSIPTLVPEVERLRYRMGLGLQPDICWQRFSAETGSEVVRHSSEMFYKATELGGEVDRTGEQISSFATTVWLLRARRKLVSSTFRWLCVVLHIIAVTLLVFVVELAGFFAGVMVALEEEMKAVQGYVAVITGNIFLLNFRVAESFPALIIPVVLVLSLVNAFAPHACEGGHRNRFFFYLGITLILSGLILWGIPLAVDGIFSRVK